LANLSWADLWLADLTRRRSQWCRSLGDQPHRSRSERSQAGASQPQAGESSGGQSQRGEPRPSQPQRSRSLAGRSQRRQPRKRPQSDAGAAGRGVW
jgi:hypothetical protein